MSSHATTDHTADPTDLRRVGDATVTVISEGTLPWALHMQAPEEEWRRAMPEADADGVVLLGLNMVHIRLGAASILVDPGFDDPTSERYRSMEGHWPGLVRSAGLHAALAERAIDPQEITHVVITHAHDDHFAGIVAERDGRLTPRFPRARHVLGRADWEGNPDCEAPDSQVTLCLGAVERLGLLDLVDDEREIAPGVTAVAAPGESPGHTVVRVHSAGETFYYLGDLVHHACEIAHPDWVSAGYEMAAIRASRGRIFAAAAAERATVIFTHEPFPGWGRIVPEGDVYRWERL